MPKNKLLTAVIVLIIAVIVILFAVMTAKDPVTLKVNLFQERHQVAMKSHNNLLCELLDFSDEYKPNFKWNATGGKIIDINLPTCSAVWVAPDKPGKYSVSITITADTSKTSASVDFMVTQETASKAVAGAAGTKRLEKDGKAPVSLSLAMKMTGAKKSTHIKDVKVWNPKICLNDTTVIEMVADDDEGNPVQYLWSWVNPHDGHTYYNSGRLAEFGRVKKPGKYTVTAWAHPTNKDASTHMPDTKTFTVEVMGNCDIQKDATQKIKAEFSYHHDRTTMTPKYYFIAKPSLVEGVKITKTEWQFGDGNTETSDKTWITHEYNFDNMDSKTEERELNDDHIRQLVTLTVHGSDGSKDSKSHAIYIQTDRRCNKIARIYLVDRKDKCDDSTCEISFKLKNTCKNEGIIKFLEVSHYGTEEQKEGSKIRKELFWKNYLTPKAYSYKYGNISLDSTTIGPNETVEGSLTLKKSELEKDTQMVSFRFQFGDKKSVAKKEKHEQWYDYTDLNIYITKMYQPTDPGPYKPAFGVAPQVRPNEVYGK